MTVSDSDFPGSLPDGGQLAVTIDPRPSQIWIYDIARGSRIPLAADGHNLASVWTPDGKRVAYSSRGDIFSRTADASSAAERVLARDCPQYPLSWSPDGRFLAFHDDHAANEMDIWIMERNGDPRPLVVTPASELNMKFSPDGRAGLPFGHSSPAALRFMCVRFRMWTEGVNTGCRRPAVTRPSGPATGASCSTRAERRHGRVLVDVRGSSFVAGTPARLFDGPFDTTQDDNYDVFPDGTAFVMVEADPDTRPTRLHVVLNWLEELKRLAAAN